jgi:Holliday junction resolvase-like predicted endonuclease
MSKVGKREEDLAVKYFQDKGFTALNTSDEGFPDLIVMKGGRIEFFAEVKSGETSFISWSQRQYHKRLLEKGFITKGVRVMDGDVKIEEERTWPHPEPSES